MAVGPENNGLAVDEGIVDRQGAHRLGDPQKRVAVVDGVSAPQGDAAGVLAGEQPVAVVRAAIERVGALAGFDLDELAGDPIALDLGEPGDSSSLGFEAEPSPAIADVVRANLSRASWRLPNSNDGGRCR